ncbi:MAG: hypothetical protein O3C60_07870 [Planctomycetota bacterium]|nr:hypothetical protein [Planctomycetota bacterium]
MKALWSTQVPPGLAADYLCPVLVSEGESTRVTNEGRAVEPFCESWKDKFLYMAVMEANAARRDRSGAGAVSGRFGCPQ